MLSIHRITVHLEEMSYIRLVYRQMEQNAYLCSVHEHSGVNMCISLLAYNQHICTDCFEVSEFNSDACAASSAIQSPTALIKREAGKNDSGKGKGGRRGWRGRRGRGI